MFLFININFFPFSVNENDLIYTLGKKLTTWPTSHVVGAIELGAFLPPTTAFWMSVFWFCFHICRRKAFCVTCLTVKIKCSHIAITLASFICTMFTKINERSKKKGEGKENKEHSWYIYRFILLILFLAIRTENLSLGKEQF